MNDETLVRGIMKREGWPKVTNDPKDLGGLTKGGITYRSAVEFFGPLTVAEFKNLSDDQAVAFYTMRHVRPFDVIVDRKLREFVIDLGVLRGVNGGVKMLQAVVGADVDGWIGKQTVAAIEKIGAPVVLQWMIGARLWHIQTRIDTLPSQVRFRNGWRARTVSFA